MNVLFVFISISIQTGNHVTQTIPLVSDPEPAYSICAHYIQPNHHPNGERTS